MERGKIQGLVLDNDMDSELSSKSTRISADAKVGLMVFKRHVLNFPRKKFMTFAIHTN